MSKIEREALKNWLVKLDESAVKLWCVSGENDFKYVLVTSGSFEVAMSVLTSRTGTALGCNMSRVWSLEPTDFVDVNEVTAIMLAKELSNPVGDYDRHSEGHDYLIIIDEELDGYLRFQEPDEEEYILSSFKTFKFSNGCTVHVCDGDPKEASKFIGLWFDDDVTWSMHPSNRAELLAVYPKENRIYGTHRVGDTYIVDNVTGA